METKKSRRGFAAMDPEKQRAIATKGGQYKGRKGFAAMTSEQRMEIARKGGMAGHGGGRKPNN